MTIFFLQNNLKFNTISVKTFMSRNVKVIFFFVTVKTNSASKNRKYIFEINCRERDLRPKNL